MKAPLGITVDFETDEILNRPEYPPRPVGVSIKYPTDRKPKYYAWGHPINNNCTKAQAQAALKAAWKSPMPKIFQNAKFDIDVAQTHMGCGVLRWEQFHDTMFLLFLNDPHAISLGLKPNAHKLLGMPPTEQETVKEWLIDNGVVKKNGAHWGAHISKAPGDIVGKYADGDVIRTEKLYHFLYPRILKSGMGGAYDRERKLLPIFLESERQGLRVDITTLKKDIVIYNKAMVAVEAWLCKRFKIEGINFDNDTEVGNALFDNEIITEWEYTKTGKRSVSKKSLTADKWADKRVFYALGYRNRLKTCLSMFMEPWLAEGERSGGYIHPNWNQVRQPKGGDSDTQGTRTGRPSCSNPNLLNVSKSFYDRGDSYEHPKFLRSVPELPLVRRYALPDKGHQWLHRDYNQQELRILAHFEDGAILNAYRSDPNLDIHTFVQSEIKRLMHRDIDRTSVKTMNFGKLYGQGLGSLAERLNTTVDNVKGIRDAQNKALPGLKNLETAIKETSKAGDPIITWGGRVYYVEPPKFSEKFGKEMTFEYKLLNYLVQGSAADVTKEAIVRYDSAKKDGRFLVTVYDEINIGAPKSKTKSEMKILKECMEGVELDVPMLSDGKVGENWGTLTKYKEV